MRLLFGPLRDNRQGADNPVGPDDLGPVSDVTSRATSTAEPSTIRSGAFVMPGLGRKDGRTMDSTPASGMTFGYCRVSTTQQDEALQQDALEKVGVDRLFVDRVSGATESRPALDEMLRQVRSGDTVVVWRLDRLGRSLRHLIELVGELEGRGVALRSLTESIDTSTPGGKLIFHVFGALAEFERDLIRERTQAGLSAARARGRVGGRPTVWTPEKRQLALSMRRSGNLDVTGIARVLGVSRASVYRVIAAQAEATGLD